jgi:O-antigen ligase
MSQVIAERLAAPTRLSTGQGAGLQRLLAAWSALGLVLSGATQLRIGGYPLGPSELIMGCWMLFVVFLLLRGMPFKAGPAFFGLTAYWLLAWTLLGLGTLVALQTQRVSLAAGHDGAAFMYLAALVPLLSLKLGDRDAGGFHWHLARMFFLFNAVFAGLLLAIAHVRPGLGPLAFWYGPRLRGWAENPNQLGLAVVAMPFLGWMLSQRTSSWFGKLGYALGIAVCFGVGYASQSDAVRVAWVASFGAVGALLVYRVTVRGRARWLYVPYVIMPALILIVGVFYGDAVVEQLYWIADRVYEQGSQGETRLVQWLYAFQAISQSPLVGFGPGAFSGHFGPFQNYEAHNSLIDWAASTGLIGELLLLALWSWCFVRALRFHSMTLLGAFVALVVCVTFSYLLRHPCYWIVVVLTLTLDDRPSEVRVPQPVSPASASGGLRLAPARQSSRRN